jgi:hypothetical protein
MAAQHLDLAGLPFGTERADGCAILAMIASSPEIMAFSTILPLEILHYASFRINEANHLVVHGKRLQV